MHVNRNKLDTNPLHLFVLCNGFVSSAISYYKIEHVKGDGFMKIIHVIFYHFLLWSGFSIVLFLSNGDKLHYKVMLFFVFLYLAYVIAYVVLSVRKQALFLTCANSMFFLIISCFFRN